MKHFRSIEAVQAASEEELSQVPGMNRAAAESVYRFFRSSETLPTRMTTIRIYGMMNLF